MQSPEGAARRCAYANQRMTLYGKLRLVTDLKKTRHISFTPAFAGAVATLLVATPDRRWVCSIPLPPHPIRNRCNPRRSHRAVTCFYVIIRYPEKIVGVIKKVHRKYKRKQREISRRKFADFAFWKIRKMKRPP
jgi:hypothetical protein